MSKRIRITSPALRTRAEAEQCLGQIRALTLEQHDRATALEQLKKGLDDDFSVRNSEISKELDAQQAMLLDWAEANPSEFADKKSLAMQHGVIGWRIGNHKLVKKSKATWDALVDLVSDAIGSGYVRTKREVDRERIIADREEIPAESLRECGLAVVQEESFFIEPKLEEIENLKEAA